MFEPRYYQQDAFEAFFNYTSENWGKNPVVVVPTAGGKSLINALIIKKMLEWDSTRILLLTHQSELIKQNYIEVTNLIDDSLLDIGIYSAGLKLRDTRNRVIFAGIQSVYKKAWELGFFNLILIDEVHLVNHKSEGMYRSFLDEMKKINKNIIIAGFSATPYRMKGGLITEGKTKLFNDICYEVSIAELMNENHPKNRDKKRYLCPLTTPKKSMKAKVDLSNVHIRMGEYAENEMQEAFCKDDLIERSIKEILEYTQDRKKVLIFSAGMKHCESIVETFKNLGIESIDYSHSGRSDSENQKALDDFKNGNIKFLCNINQLTTGYNVKNIDCISLLRSTRSPGLFVQMCGRGSRLHPDKEDCLILDFGDNILFHGPIDKIEIKQQKDGTKKAEGMPQKECPSCNSLLALAVMICPDCGYEFPQKDKHDDEASEAEILSTYKRPETYDVSYIDYSVHTKIGKPDSLRVKYYVGDLLHYDEYVCPMHEGYAQRKAKKWLDQRLPIEKLTEPLYEIDDIIRNKEKIIEPAQIIVDLNGTYPNIIGFIFDDKGEKEQYATK